MFVLRIMRGTSEFDMSLLYGNDNDRLRLLCVTQVSYDERKIVHCSTFEDDAHGSQKHHTTKF